MMQGLVGAPHIVRSQSRRHRLHALALARQQQSGAVLFQRYMTVRMSHGFRQAIHICREALLLWAWRGGVAHENNSTPNCSFYNTVVLMKKVYSIPRRSGSVF